MEHPRLHLGFCLTGTAGVWFVGRGVSALASGVPISPTLLIYQLFFGEATLGNARQPLRAVQMLKDPQAEKARRQERRTRVMSQPRKTLLRKAAAVLAVGTAVMVVTGVLMIVLGHGTGDRVSNAVILLLAALFAGLGAWRVRHPLF